jgi:hypothetical protein
VEHFAVIDDTGMSLFWENGLQLDLLPWCSDHWKDDPKGVNATTEDLRKLISAIDVYMRAPPPQIERAMTYKYKGLTFLLPLEPDVEVNDELLRIREEIDKVKPDQSLIFCTYLISRDEIEPELRELFEKGLKNDDPTDTKPIPDENTAPRQLTE